MNPGNKRAFLGKTGQKTGEIGQKNGRTKPNPGKTGRNQKFRRILVRVRASLVRISIYAMSLGHSLGSEGMGGDAEVELLPDDLRLFSG